MKFYAILLLLSVVVYSVALECTPANIGIIINKCLIQHQGTEVDILDAWNGKKARSDEAKCFRACVMTQCDSIDSTGHLSFQLPQRLSKILGAGDIFRTLSVEAVASYCILTSNPNGDVCDSAENFYRCVVDNCDHCKLIFPNLKAKF